MKKSLKTLNIIIAIITIILLIGSFPVRYYYGSNYCDLMRIIGFILLFIYFFISNLIKK